MKPGLASSKGACWKSFSTNRAIDVHNSAWMRFVPLFSEFAAQIATRTLRSVNDHLFRQRYVHFKFCKQVFLRFHFASGLILSRSFLSLATDHTQRQPNHHQRTIL